MQFTCAALTLAVCAALPALALAGESAAVTAKKAKAAVVLDMDHPGSAIFRNMGIYKSSGGRLAVCGEVESKGQDSKYTGYMKFVVMDGAAFIAQPDGGGMYPYIGPTLCVERVVDLK